MKSIGPRRRLSIWIALFSLSVLVVGCSPSDKVPAGLRAETAAGLSFAVPPDWVSSAPSTNMRAAQYTLPAGADVEAPELVVFFFGEGKGGDAESNIERWIGMITDADGKPATAKARRETRKVGAYTVSLVTADGDYDAFTSMGMSGGMGSAHGTKPKTDYRLWGAVVGPGGPWFFKATGPRAELEKAAPALKALVASLKKGA